MLRNTILVLIVTTTAVLAGCASTANTGALATPWGVGGIHSFKPQKMPPEPNAAKVDKQVAQLLDDASQPTDDADTKVRVAAK
jgi:hypothetical protein